MDTKLIIIIAFSYVYGFFEIFMGMRQKQKRKQEIVKSGDEASIWVLIAFIGTGYFLSFGVGATRMGRVYQWDTFFAIGAILTIIGLIIRISSILTLKQHFTYTVTKIEGHELVENGLYKYIRHPGYLGQLFIFAGSAAALSNWLSIISMVVMVLLGLFYRIRVEERFMAEQLGTKYIDYQKRTKKLVPMVY